MPIAPAFDPASISRAIYARADAVEEALVEAYKVAALKMVRRAKQTNTYKDQTHKLRSSIGCVVYHRGQEVYNYFESEGGELGSDGASEGLAYARSVVSEAGDHVIIAVIVAGAHYALYVEANGYDVITGSTYDFPADLRAEMELMAEGLKQQLETEHATP